MAPIKNSPGIEKTISYCRSEGKMSAKSRIVRAITRRAGYATTMNNYFRLIPKFLLCALTVMIIVSCSPPEERPRGWAKVYEDGKELFGRSDFERAVDYVRELALKEPSNDYSERGQVLSVILLSGLAQGYRKVAEAYGAGIDKLEDPAQRSEYRRLRQDSYQYARTHALHLAEVARQFVESHEVEEVGEMKALMVECPYPAVDPPSTNQLLERAKEGGWITAEEQAEAQRNALRIHVQRSLAAALGVEPAEVGPALQTGTARVPDAAFNLYLAGELVEGARIFDTQGLDESRNLVILCDQADASLKQALEILEANPHEDIEKTSRDVQKRLEETLSDAGYGLSGAR